MEQNGAVRKGTKVSFHCLENRRNEMNYNFLSFHSCHYLEHQCYNKKMNKTENSQYALSGN